METTMQPLQPSAVNRIRSDMGLLELTELAILALAFTIWGIITAIQSNDPSGLGLPLLAIGLFIVQGGIMVGSWLLYNGVIRLLRGSRGGQPRNIRAMIGLGVLTSGYTLFTWTFFDVNRWILSKFLYRGEAPVEYIWNWNSRYVRKQWEAASKASQK